MVEFTNEEMSQPLTVDLCRQWLISKVFRFRPADYGEKYPQWPGMVGLEVEMLPFRRESKQMLPLHGPKGSAEILLNHLNDGWHPQFVGDSGHRELLKVDLDESDQITFEPGGQIEFSSSPYPCLSDALKRMENVTDQLIAAMASEGVDLIQSGINPWQDPDQIGLQMSKSRYRAMDAYFKSIGPFGARMMRQTATLQVNLDFGSNEATLAKRYLAANLLAPLATALFANSPYCDGKDTGYKSYRALIWQKLDRSRTGFPPLQSIAEQLTLSSCVESYLKYVLAAPVIFVEQAGYRVPEAKASFGDWLAGPLFGKVPTLADFETHLSLHFPEVRPRGFLELRSVDCVPRYWQELPAIFYTALLYDAKQLDATLDLMLPHLSDLDRLLSRCVYGLEDDKVFGLSSDLLTLVADGFDCLPECFQGTGSRRKLHLYFDIFSARRRCPADDLKEELSKDVTSSVFQRLEDRWQNE